MGMTQPMILILILVLLSVIIYLVRKSRMTGGGHVFEYTDYRLIELFFLIAVVKTLQKWWM